MEEVTKIKPPDILEWLKEICDAPGWSAKRIADEAKLPYKAGTQEIYNTLGRTHRIHVDLVNWIIAHRFHGDLALAAEIVKGLDAKQYEKLREYADLLRNQPPVASKAEPVQTSGLTEKIPPGTVIEKHETGQKLYTPPPGKPETEPQEGIASEAEAPYASKPIDQDAFAWVRGLTVKRSPDFDLKKAMLPPRRPALEEVDELAAAAHLPTFSGEPLGHIVSETEPTEIKYDRKTHFTLKVTGRSMYPSIFDGDKVIVEKLGLHLPPFDADNPSPPDEWKKLDGEIVVAIKNEDAAAYLKRLEFTHNKKTGYRILLKSDNPKAKSISIEKEDSLWLVGVVREIVRSPKNLD